MWGGRWDRLCCVTCPEEPLCVLRGFALPCFRAHYTGGSKLTNDNVVYARALQSWRREGEREATRRKTSPDKLHIRTYVWSRQCVLIVSSDLCCERTEHTATVGRISVGL